MVSLKESRKQLRLKNWRKKAKEKSARKMKNRRVFISLAAKTLAMTNKMFRMNNVKRIVGCKLS